MARPTRIPNATPPLEDHILRFSFKHLDARHRMFGLSRCDYDFLSCLLGALRRYSAFTVGQFADNNNQDHRHSFEFTDRLATEWLAGADEELREELPWEFALCPEEHDPPGSGWRAHGIILEDVFYVVWLDPDHLVFIDGKYHPREEE